ncbi:methylated-DNA--[protein]-cysteine S-methyltransferase [soil metagenome]
MPYAPDTGAIATPIGTVVVTGDGQRITAIQIVPASEPARPAATPGVNLALNQLAQYFAGTRKQFDLPLAPARSPRGEALRRGMVGIGYGESKSYGRLAAELASGPRAVGQACARNPFPIVVPCHRVLASGGLGHYSAGDGISTKQWLLDFEAAHGDSA